MTRALTIGLSAGGTGGHMFPAEALGRVLIGRGHRVVLFTDARGKGFGERLPQATVHPLSASAVMGGGFARKVKGLMQIRQGRMEAEKILRDRPVDVAVGFGGYASVPAMLAAAKLNVPMVLHEQNATLGRANRLLAKKAQILALSLEGTVLGKRKPNQTVIVVGNPVRPEIAAIGAEPYPALQPGQALHLLVTGGSQGARIFSQVVPEAVANLPISLRERLHIMQQCRPEDLESVAKTYRDLNITAQTASFFSDMADRLRWAHIVIARAGASTVAELMAAGRPAMLVAYKYAADNHQYLNAMAAEATGGASNQPEHKFTAQNVTVFLANLISDPTTLPTASRLARAAARPQAAETLADATIALAMTQRKGATR